MLPGMDLRDTPEQAAFRAKVAAWIAEHRHEAPDTTEGLHVGDPTEFRRWQGKLAEAGLVGVTWPVEHGGQGLTTIEEVIVNSELAKAGCPGIVDHIAIGNLGPAIIAFGTEEQKQRHLAPMLHGDEGWCQLFSEPGAGSDLGGISTRARVRDDGSWRLDGQKVWTTGAHFADFGVLLARTDPDVAKHRGLTMFIVDMKAPGVAVRPLRQISGGSHFNEVFFDNVELPADAVLGAVDAGWSVAMTILMFERIAVLAAFEQIGWTAEQFVEPVARHPRAAEPLVRRKIAEVAMHLLSLRYSMYRTLSALDKGEMPGPEGGMAKIGVIAAGAKGCELIADVLGPDALVGKWGDMASEMPGLRSGGGTEEVLRNMIGERVLGLPAEPRVDKDVPFSELVGGARKAVPA
jgi:alkylation response protein AidB-like acyl-CoA dehydrogenase